MLSADTHPKAYEAQISALRSMSPSRRASLAISMSEDVRRIALGGIRQRHPDYSERDTRLALYRLLLGNKLFCAAWPTEALVRP